MTAPLTRVAVVSVTDRGAALARHLPYPHEHGHLGDTVRRLWAEVDGLVLVAATGIAVRVIAPLLGDKHTDPAVVALDDGGRWAVALAGGHHGANALATEVAALVGATPVVTTASDATGLPALDDLPGFHASGDIAAVTRAWLDGRPPTVDRTALPTWPLPPALAMALTPPDNQPCATADTRPGNPTVADAIAGGETRGPIHMDVASPGRPSLAAADGSSKGSPVDAATSADERLTDAGETTPERPSLAAADGSSKGSPVDAATSADERLADVSGASPGGSSLASTDGSTGGFAGTAESSVRGGWVVVTDRAEVDGTDQRSTVLLRPPSLVVGVGSSSGADADGIERLVAGALADAGLSRAAVGLVASVDLKRDEPGIVALADRLSVTYRTFPASVLARQDVPTPSAVVAEAVGTPSVAEAAALLAAGPGADLLVPKRRSTEATVAVARRARPEGHLAVVGLGPGDPAWRAPAAAAAIRAADVVIGYDLYVDLAADLLDPRHEVVRSPIGAEADRCADALARAAAGHRVALVCSGDPGIFAMASLVCELAPDHGDPPVTVVPGITAAHAGAAILGAPLGHDHAAVSLSDLLTPWDVIERRLRAVAEGDLVVSLYNPRSQRRTWQLPRAVEILAPHRPAGCPVAVVTDVGRPGRQQVVRTTLAELDPAAVGMLSLVVVGSSTTRWIGDRMVTPRGYKETGPP